LNYLWIGRKERKVFGGGMLSLKGKRRGAVGEKKEDTEIGNPAFKP